MAKGDKTVAVRRHEWRKRNEKKAGEYFAEKTSKPIENQSGSNFSARMRARFSSAAAERFVHFRSGGPLVEAVQEACGSRWDREIYAYVLIGIGLTAFVINFFVNFPEVEVPDSNDLLGIEQDAGQTLAIIGRQNSQKVVQSLKERTELTDPRVLRGIPLHGILCYMGDILIPSGGIGGGASEETFARSQKVDSLDFFLSHSWRDSGRLKWLLLLWQMNFRFAFLVSNVVGAVALAAFCAYPSLQNMNTFVISHVMRIGVAVLLCLLLVYGHHLTGTNPMIFLDKACINQTDPVLKEIGIKNIGGFLRQSNSMLVTWGSDYFSRLWCCYELSLYIKLRGADAVRLVPSIQAWYGVAFMVMIIVMDVIYIVVDLLVFEGWDCSAFPVCTPGGVRVDKGKYIELIVLCYAFCSGYFMASYKFTLYEQRQKLKTDLATFDVHNVKAWCCEVNHVLPDGARIPCDRDFVEASIKTWYGEEGRDGLEEFNDQVRTQLSAQVASLLGKESVLSFQFVVLISNIIAWRAVSRTLFFPYERGDEVAMLLNVGKRICLAAQLYFAFFPLFTLLDTASGFVLVWLHRRNVPGFRFLFALLGAALSAGTRFILIFWGLGPFPIAEYKPPYWVKACMFTGSIPLIWLLRNLAK
jgi:hypothetical protein